MTPDEEWSQLGLGFPPDWASAWGQDDRGVFVCVRIDQIEQCMRWIAPGKFMMGSPDSETGRWSYEGPQHRVQLKRGYWLADTPCTQAMWQAVLGSNPSHFKGSGKLPVEQVSWDDVQGFLEAFNTRVPGFAARLPTEAEWEYACRAGTDTARYGGLDEVAWHSQNSGGKTHEVGLRKPNPWGLYDMLGNVDEWCADAWSSYEAGDLVDPVVERGLLRVVRGGGWNDDARFVRAAFRYAYEPGNRLRDQGFRLARGQELRQENQQGQQPAKKPVRERR